MKKYLLILSGDFESDNICKEIALTLTPLVDSPHLKFNLSQKTLIFHFASEVCQEEIYEYIRTTTFDLTKMFILTEYNDKVSLHLPKELKTHLLDLENESEDVELFIDMKKEFMNDIKNIDENLMALLLEEVKRNVKPPSLDFILEKINEKGLNSLSQFEKDTLEKYSKN